LESRNVLMPLHRLFSIQHRKTEAKSSKYITKHKQLT